MDRRQFITASALGLLAGGLVAPAGVYARRPHRRWGLQLFTVIAPLERDFEATVRTVAAIGYKEVETVGSFGRDPRRVRDTFERYGLVSPSQHIASDALYASFSAWTRREISTEQNRANYVAAFQPDNAARLVDEAIGVAKALGQRYVVWPILLAPHLATREMVDAFIKAFNAAGAACAREGLVFTFHNHDRELARLGDDVIYDLLLRGTDPETVKMEMDFYWFRKANADPLAYLAGYPGRFRLVHVKDMAPDGDFTVVGGGIIDLKQLIGRAREAGVEHFYVEYDRSADPLKEVRASFAYLNRIR
ncbi:sugar phosphate isomerase/epimerase family protein [Sphingomonas flavalba]|uniref:sugar phosphate isomerase/epimerase family protein n=1 Tax=Sphingomonas flavalba TaxID=2559804 RepID=UPI0039E101CD